MTDLVLRPLDRIGEAILAGWFEDAEVRSRMAGMFPLDRWYTYVRSAPGRHVWIAYEGDSPVGMVDLEKGADETAWMSVIVNPALRGCGYCRPLHEALFRQPEIRGVARISVGVEPDNVASLRCVRSVGFVADGDGPDEDGMLTFTYYFDRPAGWAVDGL